jgi:hypothetical protein
MNAKHSLIIGLLLISVVGCAMYRHRQYVRDDIMAVGLNRHAFILEWGAPDIQFMQNEFQEAAPSIYEDMMGRFQQRRPAYGIEGWVYVEQNWLLIFYGERLVAYYYWDKIKDQFKGLEFSFDPDKRRPKPKKPEPQTSEEHLNPIPLSPAQTHEQPGGPSPLHERQGGR